MSGLIIKAITLEQIVALAPPMIFYSALTCWWTHDRLHLQRHPVSKLPCDPRGAPLYETKHVMEFFRQARLKAREGVYGKHGLDAFVAAHHLNCLTSEADRRATCFTTWKDYNDLIDRQSVPVRAAPAVNDIDIERDPILEKTVVHVPTERVMGRDSVAEPAEIIEPEDDEEDDDEGEDTIEILDESGMPIAVVPPAAAAPLAASAAPIIPNATEEAKAVPIGRATEEATVAPLAHSAGTVQAGPETKVPVQASPSLQTLIDKNIKKDQRRKNR